MTKQRSNRSHSSNIRGEKPKRRDDVLQVPELYDVLFAKVTGSDRIRVEFQTASINGSGFVTKHYFFGNFMRKF